MSFVVKCFLALGLGQLFDCNFAVENTVTRFQQIEEVFIAECSPGKYFWKEESPHEFFACMLFPVESYSSANAAHLRCSDGTFMCHTGTQPFQPCHCRAIQERRSLDPGQNDLKPQDQSILSNLLQLFQKSHRDEEDGADELSVIPSLPGKKFSQNSNQANLSDWHEIRTSLSTLPPKVKHVRGRRKFAKQLDTDNNLPWSDGGCPGLFRQYNNSHMFQGVLRPLTSIETCKQGCLETRNCIGVDWNKQNNTDDSKRCFFIYPESTRYGLQPNMDYCCDHFRRTYCLSSPAVHYATTPTTLSLDVALDAEFSNTTKSLNVTSIETNESSDLASVMITTPTSQGVDHMNVQSINQTSDIYPMQSTYSDEVQEGAIRLNSHGDNASKSVEESSFWNSGSSDDISGVKDEAKLRNTLEFLHGFLKQTKGSVNSLKSEVQAKSLKNIPDSGCPFAYEKFIDHSHPFGKNVTTADANSTPDECKTWCLIRSYCVAVDFNFETHTCYFLREINSELLLVNAGVNHYRKTNCAPPLKCWKTGAIRITNNAETRVTDGKTPAVECHGVCYVKQTVGSSNVIERGCLGNQTNNHGCFVDGTSGATYRTIMCVCDTNRCNGLSVEALVSQVLYLPLDGDFLDHSGIGQHGSVPPGYTSPTFTCLDKSVNCSALFTGNQCIVIPTGGQRNLSEMAEVQGQENQLTQVQNTTFAVYYKRVTTGVPQKQGIFGNSPSASINATWAIFADNMTDTSSAGVITDSSQLPTIDDFKYTAATDNSWHFAVLSYNGMNSPLPTLQYFVDGKEMLGNSRLENGMISLKDQPVTVGCVEGFNFVGFIDEVRIFSSVLDRSDIKALLLMQEANFW